MVALVRCSLQDFGFDFDSTDLVNDQYDIFIFSLSNLKYVFYRLRVRIRYCISVKRSNVFILSPSNPKYLFVDTSFDS